MRLEDPKRERAAWALAQGDNQSAVAHEVGVHRATIQKWLKDAAFSARVDEIRIAREARREEVVEEDVDADLESRLETAWKVVDAAMLGQPGPNGSVPTTAAHSNALKTIELAHKLRPKSTDRGDVPPLVDLIAQADAAARS